MPVFDFDREPLAADGEYGFPQGVVNAFLNTANELNCVIMSRVPGRAATMLINERYDLKGYFVKAKSCDWGPMAGFICSTPEFSKIEATPDKIKGQAKALKDYLNVLWSMRQPHDPGVPTPVVHPHGVGTDDQLMTMRDNAFIPVVISTARKEWLENPENPGYIDRALYDSTNRVGIAHNSAGTVCLPFAIKGVPGQANCWALLHGGAYLKQGDTWVLQPANKFLTPDPKPDAPKEKIPAEQLAYFEGKFRSALGGWPLPYGEDIPLRPVYACQNPFPAYERTADVRYKNAFAGDYDLFAVWPATRGYDRRYDLQRVSERDWLPAPGEIRPEDRPLPPEAPLFLPVPGRAFTVESTRVRGLYVEFIPAQREMDAGLEDQQLGNINQVIMDACVRLNSFAAAGYDDDEPPNVAFHSDEGGRHSITEIEWPVGVFMPRTLAAALKWPATARLAFVFDKRPESRRNFIKFIAGLTEHCEISIASGWLWDLMTDPGARGLLSDIAPAIVDLLLTGRYNANPVVANTQPLAQQLINALRVPADPPSPVPTAPNTATYTYRRVNAALQVTVPDHMGV